MIRQEFASIDISNIDNTSISLDIAVPVIDVDGNVLVVPTKPLTVKTYTDYLLRNQNNEVITDENSSDISLEGMTYA
jgi:hypothetical protein